MKSTSLNIHGDLNTGVMQKVADYTVGGFLQIPNHADFNLGIQTNFTIARWIKTDCAWNASNLEYFESDNNYWEVNSLAGGNAGFSVYKGSNIVALAGGNLSDNLWHYVVVAKVGNAYGLYVDGVQVDYANTATTWTLNGTLNIGLNVVRSSYTIPVNVFNGEMDEILITNDNYFGVAPNIGKTDTLAVPTTYSTITGNVKLYLTAREGRHLADGIIDKSVQKHTVYNSGVTVDTSVPGKFGNGSLRWRGFSSNGTVGGEQSITLSGLNGNFDKEYLVKATMIADSDGASGYLRINGDTGSNYDDTGLYSAGSSGPTTTGLVNTTSFSLGTIGTKVTDVSMGKLFLNAITGKVRTGHRNFIYNNPSACGAMAGGISYRDTATNITSLTWGVLESGKKLTAGSRIRVYARRDK